MIQSPNLWQRGSRWKWWITGLLLLATMINYMDRMTLSSVSVRITRELDLSNTQYGHLELAFGWAFAVGSLVFGFLADRLRIYYLYPVVLAAWSAMGMITGWSQGFTGLLICRTLLGFFEAAHWPCALRTTFILLDEKSRTMGNSVLQSGASVGAIITPQIMLMLLTEQPGSWRTAFTAVGGVGFLWVATWFILLRPRDLLQPPGTADGSPLISLGSILRGRRFWAVALLVIGMQTVWHIYRVWLMKFLQTGRGYDETFALHFNSLYFIATDVGCILAGALSVWLIQRRSMSPHRAQRTVFASASLLTSLSVLLPWLDQGWALLAVLMLIGAGALALAPCFYSFVQELSVSHVGRLTGLLGLWVWATTSPMHSFFGFIIDRSGSFDLGLVLAGLAPWIGVISMKALWGKPESPQSAAA